MSAAGFSFFCASRNARLLPRNLLLGVSFIAACLSLNAENVVYAPVTASGQTLKPNEFEVFDPGNIPARREATQPGFPVRLLYSSRDWVEHEELTDRRRVPADPMQIQHSVFGHRTVPVMFAVTFERVEASVDSDPITLTKILRYTREAGAKFRVLSETTRRLDGVEGAETEYVELRKGKLMRVRHWITHHNGVACQLQLIVPYDHPELMQICGTNGFPLRFEFLDSQRKRPMVKDADVPRTFESPYGYRVDLGPGEWIPGVINPFISTAEYVAYTRNQGGLAVIPLSTFGQQIESAPLFDALLAAGQIPLERMIGKAQRLDQGGLDGIALETLAGDEEDTIRLRVRASRTPTHGYLTVAWINTNASVASGLLDQWLDKITFVTGAIHYPTNARALQNFRDRDRHATAFLRLGDCYLGQRDLDRAGDAYRTALEARFLAPILQMYVATEHARGRPEEIVKYLQSRGTLALGQPWVAMEFAFAQSQAGDAAKALVSYTKCLTPGGYREATLPPRYFEDYIRCLAKERRTEWATTRLQRRINDDSSPVWPEMLDQLGKDVLPLPSAPSALGKITVRATGPSLAAQSGAQLAPPVETGVPRLKGIIWNPGRPSAQLDRQLVFQGDTLRGYTIVKIEPDSVDLRLPDGKMLKIKVTP